AGASEEESSGELTSGSATTRAQAATLQVSSIRPAFPEHPCRRPQYLQPSTPLRLPLDTADIPRRSDCSLAKRCGSRMTSDQFSLSVRALIVTVTQPSPPLSPRRGW